MGLMSEAVKIRGTLSVDIQLVYLDHKPNLFGIVIVILVYNLFVLAILVLGEGVPCCRLGTGYHGSSS